MRQSTLAHLAKLVSFKTISADSNIELINYINHVLEEHGVVGTVVPNSDGTKANLYATVGPLVSGGVALSGHSDVVPVQGQKWSTDPFALSKQGARLYGRGTCDMKGFIAVCLSMLPDMLRADLKRPIHLVISYDEETTCQGVVSAIQDMKLKLPPIKAVIIGEPTNMQPVTAHKGAYGYIFKVTGVAAHSSLPHLGVSAVSLASQLICWLDGLIIKNKLNAEPGPFIPNYSSGHVGLINGGNACNILADSCEFHWDLRTLPQDNYHDFLKVLDHKIDQIIKQADNIVPGSRIEYREDYGVPGLIDNIDSDAELLACRLSEISQPNVASFSSEAGVFQSAGLSCALLGPGSIEQAHIADEFIEIEQLSACEALLGRLIIEQCQNDSD
ncbi:acetylornithine deacetylase [Aliamphritea hakodatensis]|uniref:acetylornithine deacetylase n=1 Tax=Aliamphritea hakodatensis TaxID=2895352 RepID=UPI0022FDA2D5|nr:acetylornithine deacetylase [Aliamphritea hakodatensis]